MTQFEGRWGKTRSGYDCCGFYASESLMIFHLASFFKQRFDCTPVRLVVSPVGDLVLDYEDFFVSSDYDADAWDWLTFTASSQKGDRLLHKMAAEMTHFFKALGYELRQDEGKRKALDGKLGHLIVRMLRHDHAILEGEALSEVFFSGKGQITN